MIKTALSASWKLYVLILLCVIVIQLDELVQSTRKPLASVSDITAPRRAQNRKDTDHGEW